MFIRILCFASAMLAVACGGGSAPPGRAAAPGPTTPPVDPAPTTDRPAEPPIPRPDHGPFLDVREGIAQALIYGPDRICTSSCEFEYVASTVECASGRCAVALRATYPSPDVPAETVEVDVAWPTPLEIESHESGEFFSALAHALRRWEREQLGIEHNEEPPPVHSGRAGYALTPELAAELVAGLNEICGDTFCEGAFMWRFDTLSCTDEGCELSFAATHDGATHTDSVTWPWFGPVIEELWISEDVKDAFHQALLVALEHWERVRYEQLLGP